MEELVLGGPSSTMALSSTSSTPITTSTAEIRFGTLEEEGGTVLDSGIVPFFESTDGSQIIFKGILDANGAVILDPSFASFMSGISIDNIGIRDGNSNGNANFSYTSIPQQQQATTTTVVSSASQEDIRHNLRPNGSLVLSSGQSTDQIIPSVPASSNGLSINSFLSTTNTTTTYSYIDTSAAATSAETNNGNGSGSQPQQILLPFPSIQSENDQQHQLQEQEPQAHSSSRTVPAPFHPNLIELEEIQPPIRKGPHRCPDCGKSFPKWPQFKRHQAEHLDEKGFRCSLCPMSFNFEVNLQLHVMIHEAEESGCLECKMCPAKFTRMASLRSHVRVHEKEENLVCPECGDEFATKARLDMHIGSKIF
jgi:predicted RNA-binding Zn-ribbon protein involved in translation (DUF1610 family)